MKEALSFEKVVLIVFIVFLVSLTSVSGVPDGPDSGNLLKNETKGTNSAYTINISGGRIATINMTATTQNQKWKAIVGNITGSLTLDDSTSSTIYDWSLTTISGEIYATRNVTTPSWTNIKCANTSLMEIENNALGHTSSDDNISATFDVTTNEEFFVGSVNISVNTCPTTYTYINNVTQSSNFTEVVLTDSTNFTQGGTLIYATILEQDSTGFDGDTYDFQMIVPEVGTSGYSGQTAYYLYVELD